MRRREFVALLGSGAVAWPLASRAQQAVPVIGYLGLAPAAGAVERVAALRAGLRDLGYIEGRNITIEFRYAKSVDGLPAHAAEFVRMKVAVIFAPSSTQVEAARQATKTIPIVFATHADPVGLGHVASLARPGGNITGLSVLLTESVAKELEILKEVMPPATRIGVFWNPTTPSHALALQAAETAGAKLGIALLKVSVRNVEDFDQALATMERERVSALLVLSSPLFILQRAPLAELALKRRLPTMFGSRENVEAGGLMSYRPDLVSSTRRAATYIDKILKGAKPGDLPVEQATRFELIINLKTAKALGIEVPATLLARANEVIE
jgi:putative tryptophan/tyrosine transport system substrate-binding protein